MKVIFLGAGSSHKAGYPLASNLLCELETELTNTYNIVIREAWSHFAKFRNEATGILKRILSSTNPEVVLSLIDLYNASWKVEQKDFYKQMSKAFKQLNAHPESVITPPDLPKDTKKKDFFEARYAVHAFLECVDNFFLLRHCYDSTDNGKRKWQYLKSELSSLSKGDIVITTNWDTLAERVLTEDCRWTPRDGYGFLVCLKLKGGNSEILSSVPESSDVKVLKLHGSYGWRQKEGSSELYLKDANYLHYLPIRYSNQDIYVVDSGEPSFYQDDVKPVMVYPSFLKQLEGLQIQSVWYSAAKALDKADEIHIIGYSLPESDTAVRTLLNTVRFRLEKDVLKVIVDDPDSETRQRWGNFLGEKVILRDRSLGE